MSASLSILIVEDSNEDTKLVIRELRQDGYAVSYERVDTPLAMSTTHENRIWDVVICNFCVTHFGGTDALRLPRRSNLKTPFIYVSDTIGKKTAVAALKEDDHDYFLKGDSATSTKTRSQSVSPQKLSPPHASVRQQSIERKKDDHA
jgi:DNA-binding NtrC family response regulator